MNAHVFRSRLRFRRAGHVILWTLLACNVIYAVQAEADEFYPTRPIRLIVPNPPGGGTDIVARLLSERLTKTLGQQVVIDNRPGGGTVIGADLAAKATPSGYTLLLGTATTHAVNVSLLKRLPYDPVKDFAPISLVAILPLILVTNPAALPANSLQELMEFARKNPGHVNFASNGNGSNSHLAGEMLKTVANLNMVHVPYRGAAPALTDLMSGQVQFFFTTIPPAVQHVKAGRLRALTVASAKRSTLLPELPTTAEGGAPGVEASAWHGVLAPAGTPDAIVAKLNREISFIMKHPEIRDRLSSAGVEPLNSTPREFAAFMSAETARYARVVRLSGARVD